MTSRSEEYKRQHRQGRHHFPPEAQIKKIGDSPWQHPISHGYRFNERVLSQDPATISAAIAVGEAHGFSRIQTLGHLLWATLGSDPYLSISLREAV
jgi:hypothetical protein